MADQSDPAYPRHGHGGDPNHDWDAIHSEWDHGKMDGFYTTVGKVAMGYYKSPDRPYYYSLFPQFTLCANYFCGVPGDLPQPLGAVFRHRWQKYQQRHQQRNSQLPCHGKAAISDLAQRFTFC